MKKEGIHLPPTSKGFNEKKRLDKGASILLSTWNAEGKMNSGGI